MSLLSSARQTVARLLQRAYYAAAQVSRTKGHLGTYRTRNPNLPIYSDWKTIVGRIRQLKRDNPVIKGCLRALVNSVLHHHIMVEPHVVYANSGGTVDPIISRLEKEWKRWCGGACDFDGWASHRKTFAAIQKLALNCIASDGEVFVIRRYRAAEDGALRLQIELAERDRLGWQIGNVSAIGAELRPGIVYDEAGRPAQYVFAKSLRNNGLTEYEVIDAKDVLHVMLPDRPQMDTGDLALACVLMSVSDLGELIGNELEIKSMMSRVAGVVKGGGDFGGTEDQTDADGNNFRLMDIDRATIWNLPEGDFTSIDYNRPGVQFENFVRVSLRFIAVGMGLPYSLVAADFDGGSWSSHRQEWQQAQPMLKDLREMMRDQLVAPVYRWFVEQARLEGRVPFLQGVDDYAGAKYRMPGYRYIDPQKEAAAELVQIQSGLKSPQMIAAEHGDDWFEVIDQIKEAQEYLREEGVNVMLWQPAAGAPAPVNNDQNTDQGAGDEQADAAAG